MKIRIVKTWQNVIEHRFNPLRGVTRTVLERSGKASRKPLSPVPNLSGASKCVWQMDREA